MGNMKDLLGMLPGGLGRQLRDVDIDEKEMARVEAIAKSMTEEEHRRSQNDQRRRKRKNCQRQRCAGAKRKQAFEAVWQYAENDEANAGYAGRQKRKGSRTPQ